METFLASIIAFIFIFTGMGIKILLKKNGEFAGTCASQNPLINKNGEVCGLCGKMPENCEDAN